MKYSIAELASLLGLAFQGDGEQIISRVSGWDTANHESLIFIEEQRPAEFSSNLLPAACVITTRNRVHSHWNAILSDNPKLDFSRAAQILAPRMIGQGLIHPTAVIHPQAEIEQGVEIGPYVVVGARTKVGRSSILMTGVSIGEDCVLGENCILHTRAILYPGTQLGNRVTLHAGVIVGGDGFGYIFDGRKHVKFPQIGKVVIEDDVEVGCNTTIDRGSLGVTRIGCGTKIDNLVQIAHNVEIGRGVVIAAQTGISGSTVIEDHAIIGGQVGFGDHARVESGAVIGSKAGVLPGKIVRGGEVYWGVPVRPLREYKKLNALFGRLPEMKQQIDQLVVKLRELEEKFSSRK
jgi:UDP-3-O-[3-hydroxymyristoyl] glucosamine N-acyltransferase